MEYVNTVRQENQKHEIYYNSRGKYVYEVTQEIEKPKWKYSHKSRLPLDYYTWNFYDEILSILSSDPYPKRPKEQRVEMYVTKTK
jgi:hypothetical protein